MHSGESLSAAILAFFWHLKKLIAAVGSISASGAWENVADDIVFTVIKAYLYSSVSFYRSVEPTNVGANVGTDVGTDISVGSGVGNLRRCAFVGAGVGGSVLMVAWL